jgi:hypothetical protein
MDASQWRSEGTSKAPLRQAETVVRRGIEVADPALPCCVDRRLCGLVVDGGEEISDRRRAESEPADLDPCASEGVGLHQPIPYQRAAVSPNTSSRSAELNVAVSSCAAATTSR